MTTSIVVNSVIEWIDENGNTTELERVLWLNLLNDVLVVISLPRRLTPGNLESSKAGESKPKAGIAGRVQDPQSKIISAPEPLPVWKKVSDIEMAMKEGRAIKRTIDPLEKVLGDGGEIPQKHIMLRDEAWEIILDVVTREPQIYDERARGKIIRELCEKVRPRRNIGKGNSEKIRVSKNVVYRNLRRYWQGGKTKNALLPNLNNCGAPGIQRPITEQGTKRGRKPKATKLDENAIGINVTQDIKTHFLNACRLFFDNVNPKPPLSLVFKKMLERFFHKGFYTKDGKSVPILPPKGERPTVGEFYYWFHKQRDVEQNTIAKVGQRRFELSHRGLPGNATARAFGPGSLFEIDATIGDVYLVNRLMRWALIGRPIIYIVIDVFSRLIVGLYVALEGPSWQQAGLALANAMSDKVSLCARYGIHITEDQWPSRHVCEALYADRGELISGASDCLVSFFNISLSNTAPYRADWKPIVEQSFRIMNLECIHWLPGAVVARERERGTRDYRLDAQLDIHEFIRILINNVIAYNNSHRIVDYPRDLFMIEKDVEPVPVKLWQWGMTHRSGHLREKAPEIIRLGLWPRDEITVMEHGLKYQDLYYTCDRAEREKWLVRARTYASWKEPICFHPRQPGSIYLLRSDGQTLEPCHLLKKSNQFSESFLEEIQDLNEIESIKGKLHETSKDQEYAECHAKNEAIIAEAKKKTEAAMPTGMSKRRRIINMRGHRADENKRLNDERETSDVISVVTNSEKNKVLQLISPERSIPGESPENTTIPDRKQNVLEILRKIRDEKK